MSIREFMRMAKRVDMQTDFWDFHDSMLATNPRRHRFNEVFHQSIKYFEPAPRRLTDPVPTAFEYTADLRREISHPSWTSMLPYEEALSLYFLSLHGRLNNARVTDDIYPNVTRHVGCRCIFPEPVSMFIDTPIDDDEVLETLEW